MLRIFIPRICESHYKGLSKRLDNAKEFSLKDNTLWVNNDDQKIGCIILKLYKMFWEYCLKQFFTKLKIGNKN